MKVNNSILLALIFIIIPINEVISINDPCELVSDGTFIGDRESCDGWIRCSNGISHKGKCPEYLRFNVEKEACDVAAHVKCKDDDCENKEGQFLPDDRKPRKCSAYFYCHEGIAESYDCPDGLHYDSVKNICNYKTSITPQCEDELPENNVCINIPDGKTVRDPKDCSKYNLCKKQQVESKTCENGKLFDQKIGDCNDADKVDCVIQCDETDRQFLNPKSCLSYYECKNGNLTEKFCEQFQFVKQEDDVNGNKIIECADKMTVDDNSCRNRCEGIKSGFIPVYTTIPDDLCKNYYTCSDGKILNKENPNSCPLKYLLDYEKKNCVLEEKIDKKTCRKSG